MKLLSIIVPCYNSQDYMKHCISTLLTGGDDVEILVIDDGSSDNTLAIAQRYVMQYPEIVRAIHQENKGHGGALNTGIQYATGQYLKVVDSDDWVNVDAYLQVLQELRRVVKEQQPLDMLVTNFVYEKQGAKRKKVVNYHRFMDDKYMFLWSGMKPLPITNYLMMHSIIYRTEVVRMSGLELPENTFYVDNLYAFVPLPYVETIRYMDVNLYRYFIGRCGQSVQESVMCRRFEQQYYVNVQMIDYMEKVLGQIKESALRKTMITSLKLVMAITSIVALLSGTEERRKDKRAIWQYLKDADKKLYRRVRYSFLGIGVNLPGRWGRKAAIGCYHILQRLYGFN